MKKIVAVIIILAFALTGLAAVSAGAVEPVADGKAESITYQPKAYPSEGTVILLTSGPRTGN